MSKAWLRLISALLTIVLLGAAIASCSPADDSGVPTGTSGSGESQTAGGTQEDPEANPDRLQLIQDGVSDYVIVYSLSAGSFAIEMAQLFQSTIEALTGITIPITDDYENASAGVTRQAKEIVFGEGTRDNAYDAEYDRIGDGYRVFVADRRLVFASRSRTGMRMAIHIFIQALFSIDMTTEELYRLGFTDISLSKNFLSEVVFKSGEVPNMDVEFEKYVIAYGKDNYMQHRMALVMRSALKNTTGAALQCVETDTPTEQAIVLKDNSTLGNGNWTFAISGKTITISAADYYGFTGAASYLGASFQNGYYGWTDGFTASGSYKDYLTNITASTAYAWKRAGGIRVMLNNTLWGDNSGHFDYKDVPINERNTLQAAMYAIYSPDVLGLQEFNITKRDGSSYGTAVALEQLLKDLGYAETISRDVVNSHPKDKNCTPLFYNTKTTRLLKSEYYWYADQADASICGDNDRSSKSMTWGVFEDIATGQKYIVASTHLCTQVEEVRVKQAKAAVAVIDALIEEYDCPAFIGGDFNSAFESAPYNEFVSGGYADTRFNAEITTDLGTRHGYPVFDQTLGLMRPSTDYGGSIDFIMAKNTSNTTINLFGVIADECSLSASDHLPLFIDFTIRATEVDNGEWSKRY